MRILELKNESLENRVSQLEAALAEKTLALENVEREREMWQAHYLTGLELLKTVN